MYGRGGRRTVGQRQSVWVDVDGIASAVREAAVGDAACRCGSAGVSATAIDARSL